VVGLEFETAYVFIDNLFLTLTQGWLIFSFRTVLKFTFFYLNCYKNDAPGLFILASMEWKLANFCKIHKALFIWAIYGT